MHTKHNRSPQHRAVWKAIGRSKEQQSLVLAFRHPHTMCAEGASPVGTTAKSMYKPLIERIRQVSMEIEERKGRKPNYHEVSKKLQLDWKRFWSLLCEVGLEMEFESYIVMSDSEQHALSKTLKIRCLAKAVHTLLNENRLISLKTLVEKTGFNRRTVWEFKDLIPMPEGYVLEFDSVTDVWDAASALVAAGSHVTRLSLCERTGLDYKTIYNILQKKPNWKSRFNISHAEWGSGVANRIRKTRQS